MTKPCIMNLTPNKDFLTSALSKRRRSTTFLYPSDVKKSATTELLNYSLKARRKVRHSFGHQRKSNDLAYKVVRSPYSLEIKDHCGSVVDEQSKTASPQLRQNECLSPLKVESDSKENDCQTECNQRSPILRSRRFRRKAMKKFRLGTSVKRNTDSVQQSVAQIHTGTVYDAPESTACVVNRNRDSEHNSNELSSVDFSKIFSECFTQHSAIPSQTDVASTAKVNWDSSEINEIVPAVSNNDVNNSDDLATPTKADVTNTTAPANRSRINEMLPAISNDDENNKDFGGPAGANVTSTTRRNCGGCLSEINEIAPTTSYNDANNTFDSMFSCTDEELLACVGDDIQNQQPADATCKQGPGNLSSVNTSSDKTLTCNTSCKGEFFQPMSNEMNVPGFGFITASKKAIKVSKAALQKAENLLCYDCFGDPL